MQTGRIQDSQITASSIHDPTLSTTKGRLNSATSWSARQNNLSQWIQVDLGREEVVTSIGTQGRGDYPQWVETYSVSYGSNGNTFEPYKIDGVVKVFSGNSDHQSIVTNSFSPSITARYIRIQPITWYGYISMRFEVYGCYTGPCKSGESAFGMQNGRIEDSQITAASTVPDASLSTTQGRLNGRSSWSADRNDQNQWIQVDIGREGVVTAIGTQGRRNYPQWVKTYSLFYGSNGSAFEPHKIDDVLKVFSGNNDQQSIVTNSFSSAITARYIRIQPIDWHGHISMRFEVYGCSTGPCTLGEAAFGMQNGMIQDSQITASSIHHPTLSTKKGRLNGATSWSAKWSNVNEWIQVDLGREGVVTAIATQGRGDNYGQWVITYSVSYGSNGNAPEPYEINGVVEVFSGNNDQQSIVTNSFSPAITARNIRIHPRSWHSHVSMRLEVYGCYTAKSCFDHYKSGNKINDIYQIYPDGHGNFAVMCDMYGGGWTVFQHRYDGSVDFYLGWTEYKEGFGNLSGEFWLGLEKLHRITTSGRYKLRIDLEDFEGSERFAEYGSFEVGNEQDGFRLSIGAFSGDAGDSLTPHNGTQFTTKDVDHDLHENNCAQLYKGAWWYNNCHVSNLNGLYHYGGNHTSYADGINWSQWKGYHYSMKTVTMKIKEI